MGQRLPLRLLLAEDNTTNQKLALRLLERLGYRADVAANGLEVLEALGRQPYDVVLMDMQMPEMDGLIATQQIRQRWPGDSGPRIIAMTANAMQGDRELCIAAGMDDYISKPVRVEALVEALSRCWPVTMSPEPSGAISSPSESQSTGWEKVVPASDGTGSDEAVEESPWAEGPYILDPAAIQRLMDIIEGEQAILEELIDTFLEEFPETLDKLHQAIVQADAPEVRLRAHALKSGSNDFGAHVLAKWCQKLENMGRDGILAEAGETLSQIETAYSQVKLELERLREA
jgi:CheY-like chemotaxis protein/HPt (histidine-containing phosphotransfer) domain-containing protein